MNFEEETRWRQDKRKVEEEKADKKEAREFKRSKN